MGNCKSNVKSVIRDVKELLENNYIKKEDHRKELELVESRVKSNYLHKGEAVEKTHEVLGQVMGMIDLLNKNTVRSNTINSNLISANSHVNDMRKTYELINSKLDKPKAIETDFTENIFKNV